MTRQPQNQGQQTRVLHDLLALVLNLLRVHPTALSFPDPSESRPYPRTTTSLTRITPSGFACLMLGISVSLVFGGSVTFFIGLLLLPWVVGLVMVLYVAGIVSTVSMFGRWILCYGIASPVPRKDVPFPGN